MKLINKTILSYLLISIPLLLIAGLFSYFLVKNELRDGIDETLEREKLNVIKLIHALKEPENTYLSYDSLSFIRIISPKQLSNDKYSDSSIYNKKENELQHYRVLKSTYTFNHSHYSITLSRPTIEEEELMSSLFSAFALIIVFLMLSFFIASWLLSEKLWKPFYNTLSILGRYDLKNHTATAFPSEQTREFKQLNAELNKMTDKIYTDFIQQKEFTENASHEMQTPLAVVRANISLLMQSPRMDETEMNQLEAIENTIKKLASLNKTLILLAKIENNQYHENIAVNLKEKIEATLETYADIIQAKNMTLTSQFHFQPLITMNTTLADILVSNLLQNAIRHNTEGGAININLTDKSFSISNTGKPLNISEEDLFVRFKKNDGSKDSLGLGLSIVKSITALYAMNIRYTYSDNYHNFILYF